MRAAQDARHLGDLAGAQVPADDGRGEPLTVAHVVEGHDLEAEVLAEVRQRGHVAGVAVAEAGVHADDDAPGVQAAHEHRAHEVLRGLPGELVSEVEDEEAVQTHLRQEVVADGAGRDELGRHVGAQHGHRVRVEGHGHGGQAEAVAGLDQGGEHRPVPAVDPVEVAEGEDAGPQGLGRR